MRIRFREKTAFEAARCMESSGELLYKTAGEILRDQERRRGMSAAMAALNKA